MVALVDQRVLIAVGLMCTLVLFSVHYSGPKRLQQTGAACPGDPDVPPLRTSVAEDEERPPMSTGTSSSAQRLLVDAIPSPGTPVTEPSYNTPLVDIVTHGKNFSHPIHAHGWVFKQYISSKLEIDFYDAVEEVEKEEWVPKMVKRFQSEFKKLMNDMADRVVPHVPMNDFVKYRKECVGYINRTVEGKPPDSNDHTCLSSSKPLDADIFSRFEYEFRCIDPPCEDELPPWAPRVGDIHVSYIEPLGGLMRHPLNFVEKSIAKHLLRKDYMIVDKWALNNLFTRYREVRRNSHFFDLGASTFHKGLGGAPQSWFVGLADCMCVPFESMRLWELATHSPHKIWAEVPLRLHPHYMWYNYGLSADIKSFRNPLNHLLLKTSLGDPVIMKVDFDNREMEATIIATITNVPQLHRRVDELFFEHHVALPLMEYPWGQYMNRSCFVRCTMDVFRAMRTVGIRAHSWI